MDNNDENDTGQRPPPQQATSDASSAPDSDTPALPRVVLVDFLQQPNENENEVGNGVREYQRISNNVVAAYMARRGGNGDELFSQLSRNRLLAHIERLHDELRAAGNFEDEPEMPDNHFENFFLERLEDETADDEIVERMLGWSRINTNFGEQASGSDVDEPAERPVQEPVPVVHQPIYVPMQASEEEPTTGNIEYYDQELPVEHSYMGTMERVPGVGYLESNKIYRIMVFPHDHGIVFPGELFPMIVPRDVLNSLSRHSVRDTNVTDLFGIYFRNGADSNTDKLYGVTCQIIERSDNVSWRGSCLKTRVLQRFILNAANNDNISSLVSVRLAIQMKTYANVLILPEIHLPEPLSTINHGSLSKFHSNTTMKKQYQKMQAMRTPWPHFVFEHYNVDKIIEKAKKCLESYKLPNVPEDPILQSFWLTRNLLFDPVKRMEVFTTNFVNQRLYILGKYLEAHSGTISCSRCHKVIAGYDDLFAMSKSGVQSNFCNPGGHIHETNTVYEVLNSAVTLMGEPSVNFSWFPGYSWQIMNCSYCLLHLGWKFKATKPNLVPQKFYGLAGTSILMDNRRRDVGASTDE